MTKQTCAAFTKEYSSDSTALIVENIFSGNRAKMDVIRELIENEAWLCNGILVQSGCRNIADCGSHEKEA